MANIWNKKFDDITFEDIEHLVSEKVRESWVLDYKQKFDKIEGAKLISAMANTYGGFIVYGVTADPSNNEPREICGILDERLEDRVDSISYDAITPPVFCESKYVTNADSTRKVFLVKVPESDLTPHAIENNSVVYVKVMAQKRPVLERADLDRVAWLTERRKRSVDLRSKLVDLARHRADNMGGMAGANADEYCLEFLITPRFPRDPIMTLDELFGVFNRSASKVCNYHSVWLNARNSVFWDQGIGAYRVLETASNLPHRGYLELGCHGQIMFKLWRPKSIERDAQYVWLTEIAEFLLAAFLQAYYVYEECECRGTVWLESNISGLSGSLLNAGGPLPVGFLKSREEAVTGVGGFYSLKPFDDMVRLHLVEFISRMLFVYGRCQDVESTAQRLLSEMLKEPQLTVFCLR